MNDPLFSVADQVVLVSGGSRGIGRGIAEGFASRGARVIITGRDAGTLEAAARELSGSRYAVTTLVCDVTNSAEIQPLVENVLQTHGRIDTLINVAGINRRQPAEEVTEADWDAILDTNLKGAFLLSQAVGRYMLRIGRGSQINIASLNNYAPLKHVAPYAASKAGLGHLTRALALEWGPRGVRVNAIAPGFILTDLTRQLWAQPHMQSWGQNITPLRRLGNPQDMVGAAIFLASEAASFLTGQIITVDGGVSAGIPWPIEQTS